MKRILLVNPPIYDFTAYDFWLKPFGLLKIGGYLRNRAEVRLFDFMDRNHPSLQGLNLKKDEWGRGKFPASPTKKPESLAEAPGRFRRFGLSPDLLESELAENGPFDFALVQTGMTYWYPGTVEVIKSIRKISPETKIVIGGIYATLCPDHARTLGADMCISGLDLTSLWKLLAIEPDLKETPFWEGYPVLSAGVIKLTEGCPNKCTYCSVSQIYKGFRINNLNYSVTSLELAARRGTSNMVFYDDSLLFRWEEALKPFLERINEQGPAVNFHTPNALNARMINKENAAKMVEAGFRHFYLGFESSSREWQGLTGDKVYTGDLARAADYLVEAGADLGKIAAYIIIGHPESSLQDVEGSIRFAGSLGLRVMLSEFSPIPGTPDGDKCEKWVDMREPLHHNKIFFTSTFLGHDKTQEIKNLCREQNKRISRQAAGFILAGNGSGFRWE